MGYFNLDEDIDKNVGCDLEEVILDEISKKTMAEIQDRVESAIKQALTGKIDTNMTYFYQDLDKEFVVYLTPYKLRKMKCSVKLPNTLICSDGKTRGFSYETFVEVSENS